MGKPALNDLRGGIATAPVLFAAEEFPELSPLILRKFATEGDVETAVRLVSQSRGIERTQELAARHAAQAAQAVRLYSFFFIMSLEEEGSRWS